MASRRTRTDSHRASSPLVDHLVRSRPDPSGFTLRRSCRGVARTSSETGGPARCARSRAHFGSGLAGSRAARRLVAGTNPGNDVAYGATSLVSGLPIGVGPSTSCRGIQCVTDGLGEHRVDGRTRVLAGQASDYPPRGPARLRRGRCTGFTRNSNLPPPPPWLRHRSVSRGRPGVVQQTTETGVAVFSRSSSSGHDRIIGTNARTGELTRPLPTVREPVPRPSTGTSPPREDPRAPNLDAPRRPRRRCRRGRRRGRRANRHPSLGDGCRGAVGGPARTGELRNRPRRRPDDGEPLVRPHAGLAPGRERTPAGPVLSGPDRQARADLPAAARFPGLRPPGPRSLLRGGRSSSTAVAATAGYPEHQRSFTIGYYQARDLAFYGSAAPYWTVCDNYFSATMAETYPNRFYQHAAQTDRTHNT